MLEAYGSPIVKYEGVGRTYLNTKSALHGRFTCVQLNDARILIHAYELIPIGNVQISLMEKNSISIQGFQGFLDEGGILQAEGWIGVRKMNVSFKRETQMQFELLLVTQKISIRYE